MDVLLRGVRGSIATPSLDTEYYGGNTLCIEVRSENNDILFFDAGTGIREAGLNLQDNCTSYIFITHAHMDHLIGLWFFEPLHNPTCTTHIYLPKWLEHIPNYFYHGGLFPVPFEELKGDVQVHYVTPATPIKINENERTEVVVSPFATCHPGGALGYRVSMDNAQFVYTGDHEIADTPEAKQTAIDMIANSAIAIVDAMYNESDYKASWGHSTWERWVEAARQTRVSNMVFVHHDPLRNDQELDILDNTLKGLGESINTALYVGREGLCITPAGSIPYSRDGSDWLFLFLDELSVYRDESAILDRILKKARDITNADAGTIYLKDDNDLIFAYTHNDSLFSEDMAYKHSYANVRMPISTASIAGYVAQTGKPLLIDDVYNIPDDLPMKFDSSFDQKTNYRTKSMLVVPFMGTKNEVIGVLQLINCLAFNNEPVPFTVSMRHNARILAHEVSGTLLISALERQNVYGLLSMAAVHDPLETGPHAERVGAIAAELYQRWANKQGYDAASIRYERSKIRLASMLHDIGKVGVSDLILKDSGKLSEENFAIMKEHTRIGAEVLERDPSAIAEFAKDIALHHHQRWDGKGYPDINGKPLAGEEIPLAARLTSIADVFDALVSQRSYKKSWTFQDAFKMIKDDAGTHFDPQIVECLLEIEEILVSIYARFPDYTGEKKKEK